MTRDEAKCVDKPPFKIREATNEDVRSLTRLHMRLFTTAVNLTVLLGEDFVRAVYRWFTSDPDAYILVAETNGVIAAWTTVCDGAYNRRMFGHTYMAAFCGLIRNPRAILHRDLRQRIKGLVLQVPTAGETEEDPDNLAHLAYIAVCPKYRRFGLGSEILKAAMSMSRVRGSCFMRAGIYRENNASLRMFNKCGFKVLAVPQSERIIYVQVDLKQDTVN